MFYNLRNRNTSPMKPLFRDFPRVICRVEGFYDDVNNVWGVPQGCHQNQMPFHPFFSTPSLKILEPDSQLLQPVPYISFVKNVYMLSFYVPTLWLLYRLMSSFILLLRLPAVLGRYIPAASRTFLYRLNIIMSAFKDLDFINILSLTNSLESFQLFS